MKVDLHLHTCYSDGVYAPEKIVDLAVDAGLEVIAITDHDNIMAYDVATKYIKENDKKLQVIRGVEINTLHQGYEVHILGYFMDVDNSDFKDLMKTQQAARVKGYETVLSVDVYVGNRKVDVPVTVSFDMSLTCAVSVRA